MSVSQTILCVSLSDQICLNGIIHSINISYNTTFRFLCRYICSRINVSLKSLALSSSAFWLGGMASLIISLLEEMLESRLLMFSGMFFSMRGDNYSAGGRTAICCWVSCTVYSFRL